MARGSRGRGRSGHRTAPPSHADSSRHPRTGRGGARSPQDHGRRRRDPGELRRRAHGAGGVRPLSPRGPDRVANAADGPVGLSSYLRDRTSRRRAGRRASVVEAHLARGRGGLRQVGGCARSQDLFPVRIDAVEGDGEREASGLDPIEPERGCPASEGTDAPTRRPDARRRAGRGTTCEGRGLHALRLLDGHGDDRMPSSELLAITVSDLDLANGFVTIRSSIADGGPGRGTYRKTTKRDDWRDVPLTEQMVGRLPRDSRSPARLPGRGWHVRDRSRRLRLQRRPGRLDVVATGLDESAMACRPG